jgi:hypothetical protein
MENASVVGSNFSVSGDCIEIDTTPHASVACVDASAVGEMRAIGNASFILRTCSGKANRIIIIPGEKIVKLIGGAELEDPRAGRVRSDSLSFDVATGRVATEILNSGRACISMDGTAQPENFNFHARGKDDEPTIR